MSNPKRRHLERARSRNSGHGEKMARWNHDAWVVKGCKGVPSSHFSDKTKTYARSYSNAIEWLPVNVEKRKKKWAHRLEERARVLACQRQVSINHIMLLRYQLLELKDKCLAHTNWECEQIRQYLRAQYLESTQRRAWHIKPQLSAFQKPCQTPRRLFLLLLLLPTPIRHIWMIRGCFYKVRIRFHTRICEFWGHWTRYSSRVNISLVQVAVA